MAPRLPISLASVVSKAAAAWGAEASVALAAAWGDVARDRR